MIIAVICLLPIIPGKHTNSPMMPKDLISPGKWLSSCMHHTWIQNFFKGARESEEWFCFLWGLFSRILLCELNKFEFSDPPPPPLDPCSAPGPSRMILTWRCWVPHPHIRKGRERLCPPFLLRADIWKYLHFCPSSWNSSELHTQLSETETPIPPMTNACRKTGLSCLRQWFIFKIK